MGREKSRHGDFTFDVRFFRLSEEVQPYFTALYSFEFDCSDGLWIDDFLHPEWCAMRFFTAGPPPDASVVPEPRERRWPFVVSGPTSRAVDFSVTTCRVIGLGLHPAGFARYCDGPADGLTNTIVNGMEHRAFAAFAPLLNIIDQTGADRDEAARRIDEYVLGIEPRQVVGMERILACQDALRDPEIADVDSLAEAVGVSRRTLERLCARHFGFSPKVLLRRQRFLRSLARFMLESPDSWSKALDGQYYDQAHFVHDFRSFMGMTPSEYAAMDHPILDRIMAQRMADAGAAPQTDLPTMLRYRDKNWQEGGGNG